MSDEGTPYLHLYSPSLWHDDTPLVGTRAGLAALRAAIDEALTTGAGIATAFNSDGEGYFAVVLCREQMNDMPLPYQDKHAREPNKSKRWRTLYDLSDGKIAAHIAAIKRQPKGAE